MINHGQNAGTIGALFTRIIRIVVDIVLGLDPVAASSIAQWKSTVTNEVPARSARSLVARTLPMTSRRESWNFRR